ncbi:P2Y purinoceptor 2-like [Trichomycterus rosablanca]|uniref:P2Y purinoceptor 2-like n=1 Tax=Trichomycterus rosablanca TaxID=2290929 RepID=UPI002F356E3B
MNISNTTHCPPEVQPVCLAVVLCVVYMIGLILNGFSLWVFVIRISRWSAGTVLQFNLAISDAIACPATALMAAYFARGNNWEFGRFLCDLKIALFAAHFYGSITFLTLISIYRYVVVVHFRRASPMKSKSFVKKLCLGVWGILLLNALVYGFLLPVTTEDGHKQCLSIHQNELIDVYLIINFVLLIFGFLLPFAVALVCYSCLARSVTRISVNSQHGQSIKIKSLRMIGICLIIFGLCFLPLNAARTVGVVVKKFYPGHCKLLLGAETAYYISYIVAGINCCLDPLIYFFGSREFNRAFKRSLKQITGQQERENNSESETASCTINKNAVYTISTSI